MIGLVAMLLVIAAFSSARAEYKYVYKMRVLVEAKYGDGADEFGQKDWGAGPMGAICFDVDAAGNVYICDGPKGDVKVYDREGAYRRTVKALPWIVGGQMLADIGAGPTGAIYLAVEGGGGDDRTRLYSISPDGEQMMQLPFVLGSGMATKDGIQSFLGIVRLTADISGDVYLGYVYVADSWPGRSMRVVKSGKAVAVGDQLASLRPGWPSKWGLWVVDHGLRMRKPGPRGISVYGSDGRLKSRLTQLSGAISGTDSSGCVYERTAGPRGDSEWASWMNVISPRGVLDARIELPKILGCWYAVGKGKECLVGLDGSVYSLSEGDDRVRVYIWERSPAR